MSSPIILSLAFIGKQVTIYLGIFTLIAGVVGGFLTAVVFLSLRTFRESSCAFYLTVMSVVNIGQMLTGLLSRIMDSGFGINWSNLSLFFCKFRFYCFQVCSLTSMTCICLATIDQYLATSTHLRWQQRSNIKLARRVMISFVLIWILLNVPVLIYFTHVLSSTTGKVTCVNTNNIFQQFVNFGITPVVAKLLPICITFIFGVLAYHNTQQLAHRTVPLVRRELDKQLAVMVLVVVVFNFFTNIPFTIAYLLSMMPQLTLDPITAAQIQFAATFTTCLVYVYFASPFYIFLCVSDRFRRQLIYVVFDIYLNRWRRRRMGVNQVMPQIS